MKTYTVHRDYIARENSIIDIIHLDDFVDAQKYRVDNACINNGGWQSWNPCTETFPGKKQLPLTCFGIKQWNSYLVFPETKYKSSKNIILGQFISYLRWNDFYLFFVSVGNVTGTLPPVQFIFNRKENTVSIEICDKGNEWKTGDVTGRIEIFTADSYFEAREKLLSIFGNQHFDSISHLGNNPGGWESWYNHYANINQELVTEDLNKLVTTENIISKGNYSSLIFQIDDGWEQALGDWKIREDRFKDGFTEITLKIENENYIPGLWIAPFIIDSRSQTAAAHPDWLLRDEYGNLVSAGYNPLWGKDGTFYCLDLSHDDVISHLDKIIDTAINEWGFRYLKLDFLYAGMLYGNYHQKTASYKIYSRAIKTLTARKTNKHGKPVTYLGCGVPFELSFKYLPLSRIGCDTYEQWTNPLLRLIHWNGRNEAWLNVKDTLGHAIWNGIVFKNDPDVVFIRKENCTLSDNQKYLIAGVGELFGSQFMYSDDPGKAGESEKYMTEKILSFAKKYKNEEFGITQISENFYEIYSKSGKYKGSIDMEKNPMLKIDEVE